MQKNEKGPISHQKIKCSFLDYLQLLMIGWAIWTKNINQNTKKWKRPPKSSKNKMFVFGLCSTSDDQRSDLRIKCWPKCKKMKKAPYVIEKWNVHFWIMFNFWWPAEWSEQQMLTKTQKKKKQKRPPKSSKNKMFVFGLHSTSDDQPSNLSKKCQLKHKITTKAP